MDDVVLQNDLILRKEKGSYRKLAGSDNLIDFCSNDYLGLAHSDEFLSVIQKKAKENAWSSGSSGSRLITGNHPFIELVEQKIADFHGSEAALIFPNGYMANLGLYSSIGKREDIFILDEYVHASIIDGCRLSFASRLKFRHNDLTHLEQLLKKHGGKKWIIVESVYSMFGDKAPLAEIARLAKKYDAGLIVDEAHAAGLIGEKGEGLVSSLNMENDVFASVITFGKAYGIYGAAVVGNKTLKDFLVNYSRPFIYSTAPTPAFYCTISIAHDTVKNMDAQRQYLHQLRQILNEKLKGTGLLKNDENSQVAFVNTPGNNAALNLEKELRDKGFNVKAIRHPTVQKGEEGIRIGIHAHNTESEVIEFCNQLIRLCRD